MHVTLSVSFLIGLSPDMITQTYLEIGMESQVSYYVVFTGEFKRGKSNMHVMWLNNGWSLSSLHTKSFGRSLALHFGEQCGPLSLFLSFSSLPITPCHRTWQTLWFFIFFFSNLTL